MKQFNDYVYGSAWELGKVYFDQDNVVFVVPWFKAGVLRQRILVYHTGPQLIPADEIIEGYMLSYWAWLSSRCWTCPKNLPVTVVGRVAPSKESTNLKIQIVPVLGKPCKFSLATRIFLARGEDNSGLLAGNTHRQGYNDGFSNYFSISQFLSSTRTISTRIE